MADVMDEFYDGPHATPPPADDGPIYLGIKNISPQGFLNLSSVRHIAETDFDRWTKRVTPAENDIVFTYEATLHRYALIPRWFRGCLGRRLALIRPRCDTVDPKFLHLYLLGPEWRRTVEERIIAGATVDRLPIGAFPAFPISLPPLAVQRRIASVLSAFDELIDINERRIELLENLARSLYREWFVRFRFPGHEDVDFVDSELGLIPYGWEVRRLGDVAGVVVDGVDTAVVHSGAPYLGLEHMPRRQTTLREWGSIESVTSRKLRFVRGDTLFGKIRPYFHKVVWAPFDGVASSDAIVIRPHKSPGATGLVNAVGSSDALVARAVATSNGTKMPRADPKALLGFPMALPPLADGLIARFEQAAGYYLEAAAGLVRHNRALAATRDLLLPRLVTGRLDISDVDLGDLLPADAA
jgi:type I restriction enzyme S subunit